MDPQFPIPENWTAPAELRRATPREAQLTVRGRFMLALAILFLLAVAPLHVWMHNQQVQSEQENQLLRSHGAEAKGEITMLWSRNRGREAMVGYYFTVNGVRLRGQSSVPPGMLPAIRKAGFTPIRYLPANPAINHPALWDAGATPVWMQYVFPAMLVAGSGLLLWNLRRHSQMVAEGTPAPGVVVRSLRVKNGYVARYRFRTREGAIVAGRDRTSFRLEAGATVCVLYRTERPRANQLYPGSVYRVRTQ